MSNARCFICGDKTKNILKDHFDDRHGYRGSFDVLQCQGCGCATSFPRLSKKEMNRIYQNHYPTSRLNTKDTLLNDYTRPDDETINRLGTWINCHYLAKAGEEVLDVGCGMGFSLLELANQGSKPYGIDPNLLASRLAKKFKIPFHCGYIEDKPFGNRKFDLVCASQVLEHTGDPVRFLKDCKNRIKPDGRICLSFPNIDAWYRKILGRKWLHWHLPYHYDYLSRKGIDLIAHDSGLTILEIQTVTPNMWTMLQLRHLIRKQESGQRDVFWDGKADKQGGGINIVGKIYQILLGSNPVNRVVDYLGGGESWVVIFKKDQ